MSRRSFYLFFVALFATFLVSVLSNCNQNPFFGVGADVDTMRPTLAITTHTNGAWEKALFSFGGTCKDNVEVTKVIIKQVKKDLGGVEYFVRSWDADLSGGLTEKNWSKQFQLDGDFSGETGFKTLDIYAYDAKENFTNTRILIGVTKDKSEVFLTYPRDVDMPGNDKFMGENIIGTLNPDIQENKYQLNQLVAKFYSDRSSDNSDNVIYYFNKTVEITGYTKAANPPDNEIRLSLYDTTKTNLLYSHSITGDVSNDKGRGNTVSWTFKIDTTALLDKNNNPLDNTSCYLEMTAIDQAGQEWKNPKGYIAYLDICRGWA